MSFPHAYKPFIASPSLSKTCASEFVINPELAPISPGKTLIA